MKTYRVEWSIDIEAENSRQAAERALAIQRDPFSSATVFEVREFDDGEDTGAVTVDLDEAIEP